MNKGKNAYYIAEWNKYSNWSEDYSMLKGPNGFECCLTETEDCVWYRDGQGVVGELNRLHAELSKPITEHPDVQRLIGQVAELQIKSHELQDENERLKTQDAHVNGLNKVMVNNAQKHLNENERLKEALKNYGNHLDSCGVRWSIENPKCSPCDCGFEQTLKGNQ